MALTIASFAAMAVAARQLSSSMATFEILFFRSLVGCLMMVPVVWAAGVAAFSTTRFGLHVGRNLVHFAGQFTWVYAIAFLPLAKVTALEFTGPLWAALLAALVLGERISPHRFTATLLGFGGVLFIVQPGVIPLSTPVLLGLVSALCYGASAVMVKALTRHDEAKVIVLYMSLLQLPLGLGPALLAWVTPSWRNVPWLFAMGASGVTAHYGMARALALADITFVLPLDFLRLPFITLIGLLAYREHPAMATIAGAGLIFGGNYYSVWRESRGRRQAPTGSSAR